MSSLPEAASRPQPPTVLYVNHVNLLGGAEKSLLRLLECLDRERVRPVLAAPAGLELRRAASALDMEFYPVPLGVLRRTANPFALASQGLRISQATRQLAAVARREGVAAIHCNSLPAMLAARSLSRHWPLVWHCRDLRLPRPALLAAAQSASLIIAISRCVADHVLEVCPSAAARLAVAYNGITREDVALTRPREEVRRDWGLSPTTPLVTMVGQLVPWKRQDLFLRAGARLVSQIADVRLLLVGDDLHGAHADYVTALRALAGQLGIADRVIWAGQRGDIADVLSACDVLAHPTTDEPFGRVLIEALALGVPVVAADSAGPAEIITHGVSGLLTTPGDPDSLAAGVKRVLSDAALVERLRTDGLRRARHFLARNTAAVTQELYDELWRARDTADWRWGA